MGKSLSLAKSPIYQDFLYFVIISPRNFACLAPYLLVELVDRVHKFLTPFSKTVNGSIMKLTS